MIDVQVALPEGWRGPSERELEAAALAALATAPARPAELSVALVSAAAMRALNRDYHGADAPTDVLAFPLGRDPLVGDIYVCPAVASRADAELEEEILRLVIHAVLHLLGHDHPEGEARYSSAMFATQERVLAELRPPA